MTAKGCEWCADEWGTELARFYRAEAHRLSALAEDIDGASAAPSEAVRNHIAAEVLRERAQGLHAEGAHHERQALEYARQHAAECQGAES